MLQFMAANPFRAVLNVSVSLGGHDRPCPYSAQRVPTCEAPAVYFPGLRGWILTRGAYIMTRISRVAYCGLAFASMLALTLSAAAQVKPDLYAGLKWRNVGPFHGGRISSVTGVIGQAGVFYVGTPQGGIWKTTSAGVTWFPSSTR